MSINQRSIQRESFSMVPETCPRVDAALSAAADAIKDQTGALREALNETIERAMVAEEEAADLKRQLESLQQEIDELKSMVPA